MPAVALGTVIGESHDHWDRAAFNSLRNLEDDLVDAGAATGPSRVDHARGLIRHQYLEVLDAEIPRGRPGCLIAGRGAQPGAPQHDQLAGGGSLSRSVRPKRARWADILRRGRTTRCAVEAEFARNYPGFRPGSYLPFVINQHRRYAQRSAGRDDRPYPKTAGIVENVRDPRLDRDNPGVGG